RHTRVSVPDSLRIMPPKSSPLTYAAIHRIIKKMSMLLSLMSQLDMRMLEMMLGDLDQLGVKMPYMPLVKEYNIVAYTQRFNELALMCPRMVDPERVKVGAYIQGLIDNIKGEVTSSRPANLNEAVRMAQKLMDQKSQARDERISEGKKRKWESFQSRNSSGKGNQTDNLRQTLQNNQKLGNVRAMVTDPTDGKLPLCEQCFTRHVGQCTIKCHKCGKVGHKIRYYKGNNVATGVNALPIPTRYDYGEQGHIRNLCPKNVKSFMDTRFISMLDIDTVKLGASYEVELVDERVVSMNTVLKGCTLNLVNHIFEIDLMPIELGTFDVII
nr:hypothetical protein [Tanacetum cinerariifolium]